MQVFSRYECKYLVPVRQLDSIRRWLAPFIKPDKMADPDNGNAYTLASIYLDSPDLRLYRMTVDGLKNRFKLRIRSYSDASEAPLYFEIKRRVDQVILKSRVEVAREVWLDVLDGRVRPSSVMEGKDLRHMESFMDLHAKLHARPILHNRYVREAYQSHELDPVRITFDTQLCYIPTPDTNLRLDDPRWRPVPVNQMCEYPLWRHMPEHAVIMEVKFTNAFPAWVAAMTQAFQLQKLSVPKYNMCVNHSRLPLAVARLSRDAFEDMVRPLPYSPQTHARPQGQGLAWKGAA